MRFDKIARHEESFFKTKEAIYGAKFELENKSIGDFKYIKCRPVDKNIEYYYNEKHEKTSGVIHFTEGYIKSDLYYLTHKGHISVPFTIARNGAILNLHSSYDWSYHLGKKASGGNTTMSKATIGIELSNIGGLKREGDYLVTRYGDKYCHVNEHKAYHAFKEEYRGYYYFATFTDEQYDSLASLLIYLNKERGIELNFLPLEKRFEKLTSEEVKNHRGILTHVNFRDDLDENGNYKKVDIGKAFQWERLEKKLGL